MENSRVVFVTGGASGIGRAFCELSAEAGSRVVISDLNSEAAEELAQAIRSGGGQARSLALDVRDEAAMEAAIAGCFELEGGLDRLFLNAGLGVLGELRDSNLADWRRVLDVNLLGAVHGVAAAYPRLVKQGSGHLILTSSLAGLIPAPTGVHYATSKHALTALGLSLRAEAAGLGVKVSVACPGFVRTGFGDAAAYRGVDRAAIFDTAEPNHDAVREMAAALLRGVDRNQAVITHPAWVRWAWWLYRACPAAFVRLVGARIVARHRAQRG